jgi:hypothetical protein
MKEEVKRALAEGIKGGAQGATVAAASSIVSGIGMTTVPVTTKFLFWTIASGSTMVVAAPVVTAVAVGGGVLGFGVYALKRHLKDRRIRIALQDLINEAKAQQDAAANP